MGFENIHLWVNILRILIWIYQGKGISKSYVLSILLFVGYVTCCFHVLHVKPILFTTSHQWVLRLNVHQTCHSLHKQQNSTLSFSCYTKYYGIETTNIKRGRINILILIKFVTQKVISVILDTKIPREYDPGPSRKINPLGLHFNPDATEMP